MADPRAHLLESELVIGVQSYESARTLVKPPGQIRNVLIWYNLVSLSEMARRVTCPGVAAPAPEAENPGNKEAANLRPWLLCCLVFSV